MRLAWLFSLLFSCGCLFGFDPDFDHDDPDPTPLVSIATGAELGLRLERGGTCSDTIGMACLSERPETILEVTVGNEDVIELGARELDPDRASLVVELRAKKPGTTTLEVTYLDASGVEQNDVVDLRVADLERVELDVLCSDFGHTGSVFPVTTGAEVPFRHDGFDVEGNALATGRMEVVRDFGGFAMPEPPSEDGEIRHAIAPSSVGTHEWPLVGDGSESAVFPVFVAGQFELALEATDTFPYPAGVRVRRVVDGAPICMHEGEAIGRIEVTSGGCLPLVAGVEIVGEVPVRLTEHDVELGLSGTGTCEVQATLGGGNTAAIALAVDNPAPTPEPGTGTALGPAPIEHGGELDEQGACTTTTNVSNGNCQIIDAAGVLLPDADCLFDVDWGKHHIDPTDGADIDGGLVGVGLATELHVDIRYELIGFIPFGTYAPNDLVVTAAPTDVSIASRGCTSDDAEVIALVPATAIDYALELSAKNAFDTTSFELRARTVDRFAVDFGVDEVADVPGGTQAWFFVGSRVDPTFRYEDADGTQLHGTAPILASSDDAAAGATIDDGGIETGVTANVISLASSVAAEVHRIGVVDAASVAGVQGLGDQVLAVDTEQCFTAHAVGADGTRIHGTSPVRPRLQRAGDDALVFEPDLVSEVEGELCLRAVAPGATTLQLDWGAASVQAAWTVP